MKKISTFLKFLYNSKNSQKALIIKASSKNEDSLAETQNKLKSLGYQVVVQENKNDQEEYDLVIEIK